MIGAPEATRLSKLALYEWLGRHADLWTRARIVCVSNELAARLDHPPGSVVIHNGVETPPARGPRPAEFSAGIRHLVAVGRLEPVKGIDLLIKAIADPALRDSVRLHLVGDGPVKAELEALVRALGLTDTVSFLGFRADALDLIAHADGLVLSSLHEGIPYVLLEALAVGTPVVATRVGGIPEVIRDDCEGLLVSSGSVQELRDALCRLMDNHTLGDRLRDAGKNRIATEFSAATMARRYADVYREELAVPSPR